MAKNRKKKGGHLAMPAFLLFRLDGGLLDLARLGHLDLAAYMARRLDDVLTTDHEWSNGEDPPQER